MKYKVCGYQFIDYEKDGKRNTGYRFHLISEPVNDGKNVDLIIGGPPCQSFSTVGKRVYDDKAKMFRSRQIQKRKKTRLACGKLKKTFPQRHLCRTKRTTVTCKSKQTKKNNVKKVDCS